MNRDAYLWSNSSSTGRSHERGAGWICQSWNFYSSGSKWNGSQQVTNTYHETFHQWGSTPDRWSCTSNWLVISTPFCDNTTNLKKKPGNYKFNFILAIAQTSGSLWETTIKAFNHHFRWVVGQDAMLCLPSPQIDRCLNSRPLTALSKGSSDKEVLKSEHFLVRSALQSILESDLARAVNHRLSLNRRCSEELKLKVVADVTEHY